MSGKKKVYGLIALAAFAMMQISACFVAGAKCEGFFSVFFYVVGGISCLFGIALDFLLLIIAVDVFGSVFGVMAESLAKKQAGEDEDEEDEEVEVVETAEEDNPELPQQ
jgi:hypothetical protein